MDPPPGAFLGGRRLNKPVARPELVHFVATWGAPGGGIERYVETVVAGLAGVLPQRVVAHNSGSTAALGAIAWPFLSPGAEVSALPGELPRSVALFHFVPSRQALGAIVARGWPVAVFCHDHLWWCPSGSRYYATRSAICGIRAGAVRCGVRYHAMGCGSVRPGEIARGFRRASEGRHAISIAAVVLCASRFMADLAVHHGAPGHRVKVLPLPVTVPGTAPWLDPPPGPPVVLCASRLTRLKGIAELLAAFGRMRTEARLVIANDGNDRERLNRLISSHPRRGAIELRGFVRPDALPSLFRDASVVVVPSLWPEPFGLVGIEALAFGRPVVASGTGGMDEWAAEALGVQVAAPRDSAAFAAALDRAVGEPQWMQRARTAGSAFVLSRHSLAEHRRALVEALSPLLEQAGSPP